MTHVNHLRRLTAEFGCLCRAREFVLLVGWINALFFAATLPQRVFADDPLVERTLRTHIQDRNYEAAVPVIDGLLKTQDSGHDFLTYVKGRVLVFQQRYDEAVVLLNEMNRQFPDSPWLRRARFSAAAALIRTGDFREAELIYRKEANSLLSVERRQEFIDIYLEFANTYFQPAKEGQDPDFHQARDYYLMALELGPKLVQRLVVELRIARCYQELEEIERAIELYQNYVTSHPQASRSQEARFRLGECYLDLEAYETARRAWQDLLAENPESKSDWVAQASYQLAKTWQIPEPNSDTQLDLGVAALEAFLVRFPAHELAAPAHLDIARSLTHREQYGKAASRLEAFLADARYTQQPEVPQARNLLGKSYQMQKEFARALGMWREYLAQHPADAAWSEVQQHVVDTEYQRGIEFYRTKNHNAARKQLEEFANKYPLDKRNPGILLLFGQMFHAEQDWDAALAQWRRLVSKHPQIDESSYAQFLIARSLEQDLGKPEEALEQYRKVTWGNHEGEAQEAIDRLTAKSMTLATERVFRSDETPSIRLTTRNIPSVSVRVYRVNLEAYFRMTHAAGNVEQLDIALIDPNARFEFEVPNYGKYKQLESSIEVALPADANRGAMAVTVSSPTLEATTLVVQSDLDMIVKSSRDEVFVFAENMRSGKPWPGARLLISDSRHVFSVGKTGNDGVFRRSLDELHEAVDVRVLAVADGHVASNVVGLEGLRVDEGLGQKGYVYTDRPAYRAGQRVHVRGCIRTVTDDEFSIPQGKDFTLDVIDPRNRIVWQQQVTLNEFGSFHTGFPLPRNSTYGRYRVRVQDQDGSKYQGRFQVQQYKLEPVRLSIDAARRVVYRGEFVEGTVHAEYYYGAPLVGREVRYQLADDRVHTGTTDARGEVRFKLNTREFHESQVLRLKATLPERNLESTANIYLSAQAFAIGLKTQRDVFVAGEGIEVTVTTSDAEGQAVGRSLKLKIFELTTVNGRVGERLVDEQSVETPEKDGVLRKTFQLDAGGRYRLRAVGSDRLGNTVSSQLEWYVSDAEDRTRLRILADRQTFKVGETAKATLFWREKPALALVALQGSRVLQYQLLALKTGANDLSIRLTPGLAPNFELHVAVMNDVRPGSGGRPTSETPPVGFHQAGLEITVESALHVDLSYPSAKSVTPGEPLEVTVTATDPQGKPVAAELSLAMIQQALLEQFPWPMDPIQDVFRTSRREVALRTASSISFDYRPETKPIHPRLLSEQQRVELAQQEAASRRRPLESAMGGYGAFGGLGGGFGAQAEAPAQPSMADFDSLIGLIEGTFSDVLGVGVIEPMETNLSLVVSQTQDTEDDDQESDAGTVETTRDATGYWNPTIYTDENGRATVTVTMPPFSTAWTIVARGITRDTLAGEASMSLVAKKELFGQLKLPSAFTDGDEVEIAASVHNYAVAAGEIDLVLTTRIGGRAVQEKRSLEVSGHGVHEVPFKIRLQRPDSADEGDPAQAVFQLAISVGAHRDVARRVVPLLPYAQTVFSVAGGSADASATAWVEAPQQMPFHRPHLQIRVGSTVEQSLLDVVFPETAGYAVEEFCTGIEATTSDLMAALGLQKMFDVLPAGHPEAARLDVVVRAAVGTLCSAQNDDGGWGWSGLGGQSDAYMTARAVWSLSLARSAGYPVEDANMDSSLQYLSTQMSGTDNRDYESKAVLLHALTVAGREDFSQANRLYRERSLLSGAATSYLALTFIEMDRQPFAGELLSSLAQDDLDQLSGQGATPVPWNHSVVETRALQTLAALEVAPEATRTKELVDWVLSRRVGRRWSPDKATGPAVLALCEWFAKRQNQRQAFRLIIDVNGSKAHVLELNGDSPSQVVEVPTELLVEGQQRVRFQLEGRARFTYQLLLSGVVPADQMASSTTKWKVERDYEPAPLERDGREIPRGFKTARGRIQSFRNPLTELPVARRGFVELRIRRTTPEETSEGNREYLVVSEPIPNGVSVIEPSVRGSFERFEIRPGSITFYLGNRLNRSTIHYEVFGYLAGTYRAAPTTVRDAHRPDQWAVAEPKSLTVLPRGGQVSDAYRMSPEELHALGKRAFDLENWKEATTHLSELVTKWELQATAFKSAVRMLLDSHLELGNAAESVRYFEIVREKWPDAQIPFAKIVKVGAAYHDMGEFERSYLVYRATVESNFTLESGVAGYLAGKNEFLRSVQVMGELLRDYPPEPYVAAAHYGLAQQVYAKSSEAAEDAQLRELKINRMDLVARAWRMLDAFLTSYPEDPAADQAAFSAANALLELEKYDEAAAACENYARRYPNSDLLDSYWFIIGYCRYALGEGEPAGEMFRKVAEFMPLNKKTGRPTESPNKWPAIYILGQIYHSLGKAAEAIDQYRLVEDRFPDAKKSIEYFLRKDIHVPEITTVRPGQSVELSLRFRNLAQVAVKVYRIDLMKFALLRQDLSGITQINLAGIEPHFEATIPLGDGNDYRDRNQALPLPLKDDGAYLLVCRGDSLFASGLVLLSPLELEVQHDAVAREVRATVKDVATDSYLHDVQVKVTGSGNSDFVSGSTDRRGLFVAEGIVGGPTVIAQASSGSYAFHRGAIVAIADSSKRIFDGVLLPAARRGALSATRTSGGAAGIVVSGPGSTPGERKIEASLDLPAVLSIQDMPLVDVAAMLQGRYRFPVQIDRRALEDYGIDVQTPVTFQGGGTLRSVLNIMLRELDLTYQVDNESLVLTTPEEAEMRLTTVIYPVSDLVRYRDSDDKVWADYDTLIATITSTLSPDSWDAVGGPGSIEGMQHQNADVIVLSQTQDVHRQIASLLDNLRSIPGAEAKDGEPPLKDRPQALSDDPFGDASMGNPFGGGGMGGLGGEGAAASSESGHLLKGLRDTQRRLQRGELNKMQRMYDQGMGGGYGGVQAGGAF